MTTSIQEVRELSATCDLRGLDASELGTRLVQGVREHGYALARTKGLTNRKLLSLVHHFGDLWDPSYSVIDIRYNRNLTAGAFTHKAVPPHCECSFDAEPPRYVLFYCAIPSDAGGAFYLISMKEVLARLRKTDRRALHTTTYNATSFRTGVTATRPLIANVDGVGDVLVYASDPLRINKGLFSFPGGAPSEALFDRVGDLVADPALHLRHRWERGDVIVVDNTRFMHGREKYRGDRRHIKVLRIGRFTA